MEPYVAFFDDAILKGTTPLERSLEGQTGATIPRKTPPAPAKVPTEEVAPIKEPTNETALAEEPTVTKAPTSEPVGELDIPPGDFPGWSEVLHPTQSVASTGEIP